MTFTFDAKETNRSLAEKPIQSLFRGFVAYSESTFPFSHVAILHILFVLCCERWIAAGSFASPCDEK